MPYIQWSWVLYMMEKLYWIWCPFISYIIPIGTAWVISLFCSFILFSWWIYSAECNFLLLMQHQSSDMGSVANARKVNWLFMQKWTLILLRVHALSHPHRSGKKTTPIPPTEILSPWHTQPCTYSLSLEAYRQIDTKSSCGNRQAVNKIMISPSLLIFNILIYLWCKPSKYILMQKRNLPLNLHHSEKPFVLHFGFDVNIKKIFLTFTEIIPSP